MLCHAALRPTGRPWVCVWVVGVVGCVWGVWVGGGGVGGGGGGGGGGVRGGLSSDPPAEPFISSVQIITAITANETTLS